MKQKRKQKISGHVAAIIILLTILLVFVFGFRLVEDRIYEIWPSTHADYSLIVFTAQFLRIALTAAVIAMPLGFFLGLFCFTGIGSSSRIVIEKSATILNTIPTIAVLLIVVNVIGYGVWPTIVALVIQALLPIAFATIAGIENVSPVYLDAAKGLGMTRRQILRKIQIPLAFPVILSGIKTSVILCFAASTLSTASGAGGLGRMVQAGYDGYNSVLVFEGTVPICLIALLVEQIIKVIEIKVDERTFGIKTEA